MYDFTEKRLRDICCWVPIGVFLQLGQEDPSGKQPSRLGGCVEFNHKVTYCIQGLFIMYERAQSSLGSCTIVTVRHK